VCFSVDEREGVWFIWEGGNLLVCFVYANLDEDCTRCGYDAGRGEIVDFRR
jgi:hypothetical protein